MKKSSLLLVGASLLAASASFAGDFPSQVVSFEIKDGSVDTLNISSSEDKVEFVTSTSDKIKITAVLVAENRSELDGIASVVEKSVRGNTATFSIRPSFYRCVMESRRLTINGVTTYSYKTVVGACISDIRVEVPADALTQISVNNKTIMRTMKKTKPVTASMILNAIKQESFDDEKLEKLTEMLAHATVDQVSADDAESIIKSFSFDDGKISALKKLKTRGVLKVSAREALRISKSFSFSSEQEEAVEILSD